jgi:NADPH:quinone reductase-like Zn-dependent oxidoreductase
MRQYSLPLIPGWDLSCVVEKVGPGVTRFQKGAEVYSRPDIARNGAYAQCIVARGSEVALKPKSIDHLHAAAVPHAALTAWQALFDTAELQPGQNCWFMQPPAASDTSRYNLPSGRART